MEASEIQTGRDMTLEEAAGQAVALVKQLSEEVRSLRSLTAGAFIEENRVDKRAGVRANDFPAYPSVSELAPSDVTIEAIWDKARQLHACTQDLGSAFGSMIYGPQPVTQALNAPPMPEDRLSAIFLTLQQSLDDVNRVADMMRRRA